MHIYLYNICNGTAAADGFAHIMHTQKDTIQQAALAQTAAGKAKGVVKGLCAPKRRLSGHEPCSNRFA